MLRGRHWTCWSFDKVRWIPAVSWRFLCCTQSGPNLICAKHTSMQALVPTLSTFNHRFLSSALCAYVLCVTPAQFAEVTSLQACATAEGDASSPPVKETIISHGAPDIWARGTQRRVESPDKHTHTQRHTHLCMNVCDSEREKWIGMDTWSKVKQSHERKGLSYPNDLPDLHGNGRWHTCLVQRHSGKAQVLYCPPVFYTPVLSPR